VKQPASYVGECAFHVLHNLYLIRTTLRPWLKLSFQLSPSASKKLHFHKLKGANSG